MSKKNPTTKAQQEAKIAEAKKRQEDMLRKKMMKERAKKIGIVIVCVILVLGLSIPTVALSVIGAS